MRIKLLEPIGKFRNRAFSPAICWPQPLAAAVAIMLVLAAVPAVQAGFDGLGVEEIITLIEVGVSEKEIIAKIDIAPATLQRLRQRCCEVGPLKALERQKQVRVSRPRKLDGEAQARLTRLACSDPPEGSNRWTLRLLADKLVELEVVESISHQTVGQELKKMKSNRG